MGATPARSRREMTTMRKTYQGSCHCGAVRFEADLDLTESTYRCNCSICRRTRFWAAVAREDGFRLLAGAGELTQYLFNSRKNEHWFCRHCGARVPGENDANTLFVPAGTISEGGEGLRVRHHLFVGSKAGWDEIGDAGAQHVEGLRSPPP